MPDVSVLKMGMINPIPAGLIKDFASKVDKLYIIEEGNPYFEEQIRAMELRLPAARTCSPYRENTAAT